jgi:hypothetical protein
MPRSSDVAALGLSQTAEPVLQCEGLLVLLAWLANFLARAHHPCLQPSFLVDPAKNLFYCYGCGRGGDLIRFVELYLPWDSATR